MNASVQLKQFVTDVFSPKNLAASRFLSETVFAPAKRTKIWELRELHHCPIVGVCLSIDELVRFGRRFSFASSLRNEYALHVEAVNRVGSRNAISKVIQKHLDIKYKGCITCFNQAKTDDEVLSLWQKFYARGEGAGAMWASLTHKAASSKTRNTVHESMHMLSHQMGAGQAADSRRLLQLEKENSETRTTLKRHQRQQVQIEIRLRKKLDNALNELEVLRKTNNNVINLQTRIATLESGKAMTEMSHRLMELTAANKKLKVEVKRISVLEGTLEVAYGEVKSLAKERDTLIYDRDALENIVRKVIDDDCAHDQQNVLDEHTIAHNCVLCVGGRIALLPQYRVIAKKLGITLIHHDGGQEESLARLPDLISRSSAAICPTDCVSHAAYFQLKRHCKRSNKPCLVYKGAGVSSFAKALVQLSVEQANQGKSAIRTIQEIVVT